MGALKVASLVLGIPACTSALVSLAAVAAAITKRWHLTYTLARIATACAAWTLAGIPLLVIWIITASTATATEPKAMLLGKGISIAMNWGAISLPSAILGSVVWWLAARRLRG